MHKKSSEALNAIDAVRESLVETEEKASEIQGEIDGKLKKIESIESEIEAAKEQILSDDDSILKQIEAAKLSVGEIRDEIRKILEDNRQRVIELASFHKQVYGGKDDASGDISVGLKAEFESRKNDLLEYEKAQRLKHEAMFTQIETLIPGATSAGLATSYKEMKDSFTGPLVRYSQLFYASMIFFVVGSLISITEYVTLWPPRIEFVTGNSWNDVLRQLLFKAPFVGATVWLALFSARRRSEYARLQQEYAHKEVVASSYESYRKQLAALGAETSSLQKELMSKAIEALARNASVTLDGKSKEKTPGHELLEKMSTSEMKTVFDVIKSFKK
jgi:hypothetical protein